MTKRLLSRALGALMLTTLGATAVAAQTAAAAPTAVLNVSAPADIKTHVGALVQQDVQIDPGTFSGTYNTDTKAVAGGMQIPAATFSYNALGILPVTVTFHVDQVAPGTTGTLDLATGEMEVTHHFDVRLSSVSAFGFLELLDPATVCKTVTPTTSPLSGNFTIADGGVLTGGYTIPPLENCGFLGGIVSLITAGADNTLEVTLGPPTIGT